MKACFCESSNYRPSARFHPPLLPKKERAGVRSLRVPGEAHWMFDVRCSQVDGEGRGELVFGEQGAKLRISDLSFVLAVIKLS